MNTHTIIGLVVAILVVGGGAWYFTSNSGGSSSTPIGTNNESTVGSGTFASLVGRVGSWKCDIKTYVENAPSEGTTYISDGKVRANFTSDVQGSSVVSHMISADGYVYTWSDAYPQGMKMKIPEGDQATQGSSQGTVSPDSPVDYSCAPTVADAGMFTPPADITFMELGEGGMPSGIPELPDGVEIPQGYPMPN